MDSTTIEILVQSLSVLGGFIIGFVGSYLIMKSQHKYEKERRIDIYISALKFIQDYRIKHQNGKRGAVSIYGASNVDVLSTSMHIQPCYFKKIYKCVGEEKGGALCLDNASN